MDNIINTRLLSHPINWLVVWTVLGFGVFAYALVHEHLNGTGPIPLTVT